jgi:hypothetical protein
MNSRPGFGFDSHVSISLSANCSQSLYSGVNRLPSNVAGIWQ